MQEKKSLWKFGTKQVVYAAIGAALGASFAGQLGVTATSGPGMALKAAAQAASAAYGYLRGQGTTLGINVPLMDSKEMHELMGFPDVWEFEKRWHTGTGTAD